MANVYRNQFARGWNGASGDPFVVHRTGSGKKIVATQPPFNGHPAYDESQPMHQAAVRDSALYASFAEHQEEYIRLAAAMGTSAYALAVADWYGAPRVLEINVDRWTGHAGEVIRIKARDNVMVARVVLVIRDEEGQIQETGRATQVRRGSAWWHYRTQSFLSLTPFPPVQAIAFDLPGNRAAFTIS